MFTVEVVALGRASDCAVSWVVWGWYTVRSELGFSFDGRKPRQPPESFVRNISSLMLDFTSSKRSSLTAKANPYANVTSFHLHLERYAYDNREPWLASTDALRFQTGRPELRHDVTPSPALGIPHPRNTRNPNDMQYKSEDKHPREIQINISILNNKPQSTIPNSSLSPSK